MGDTYFEHKSLHKYILMARDQDRAEVKSIVDLVLVKKDILHYVQDVRAVRVMGQDLSDHYVVLCKVRLVGTCMKRKEEVDGARRIRSEKLREDQHGKKYTSYLESKKLEWNG